MKSSIFFSIIFLLTACGNINDNKDSVANPFETDSTEYNSLLTYDCNENLDTITAQELIKYDSLSNWGKHIIAASNQICICASIRYLNKNLIKDRVPGYYGRNSKHLTFYLFDNSNILFSNDFIQYDTICITDISELVQQYYFEEKMHLKYEVNRVDKGIDIRIYKNINQNNIQIFIDTLSVSYIKVINKYCKIIFEKEYKKLFPIETIKLSHENTFSTEITISSFNSPYLY